MTVLMPYRIDDYIVRPFLGNGRTRGGLLINMHDALPPVLARVTEAHPRAVYKKDDLLVMRPGSFDWCSLPFGYIAILNERGVMARVNSR